jgi:hypothetical protein
VKDFYETLQLVFMCAIPISVMGMSAFLIYKQSDGWGWFLIVAMLIVGSLKIKVGS